MSSYYTGKRSRNIYDPSSEQPYSLSRSRIENFLKCRRCFYIDRRLGVDQPPGFPFNLNSAVDALLKKEFDIHRAKNTTHPLMEQYGIDAVPFAHEKMNEWRDPFKGVRYLHEPTDLLITGGVDDIWQNSKGELHVVDYKATSKDGEVGIEADWQIAYKRQIEMYQWLLRQNEFEVSDTGYFVYVNGRTDVAAFDGKLEFDVKVIPYKGNDEWMEGVLYEIKTCLDSENLPPATNGCDYCIYRKAVQDGLAKFAGAKKTE